MKPSTILDKAADLIGKRGWCQGEFHKSGDGYCILGAIRKISPNGWLQEPFGYLVATMKMEMWWNPRDLAGWKDAKGRTKREVLSILRKSAKNARKAGQ